MTEKKFLALLNLYLDGEIDSAAVGDLEREILSNPARRRTYSDYCRIHRATKLVYEQFRAAAADEGVTGGRIVRDLALPPATGDHHIASGRTGGRATPRPFRVAVLLAGTTAAACAAVLLVAALVRPPATPGSVATSPASPAVEQPATTIAASPAVTAQVASFTAPFDAGTRADPYFVDVPVTRRSPFSLTPPSESFAQPGFAPAAVWEAPRLQINPRFIPTVDGSGNAVPASDRRALRFLRAGDDEAATVAPVGLEIER